MQFAHVFMCYIIFPALLLKCIINVTSYTLNDKHCLTYLLISGQFFITAAKDLTPILKNSLISSGCSSLNIPL